eukprot:gene34947-45226_t
MSDFVENTEQEIQTAIVAAETRQRAQSRCSVCKLIGHNKRNCPQNNNTGSINVQRVGARPVNFNGNLRDLEPRDLSTAEAGDQDGSSIGSNMESDGSDEDDIEVEDAPEDDPQLIHVPEFIPYPEPFPYGPTDTYDIIVQEDDRDTLHMFLLLAFDKMFSPAMLASFVTATNSYGNFAATSTWRDTDAIEMKAFFGVILYLGICKYPNRKMAWSPAEGSAKLRGMMSKKRFEQILAYWHYTDFTALSKQELEEIKKNDPFWAVSDFCKKIAENFEQAWNP